MKRLLKFIVILCLVSAIGFIAIIVHTPSGSQYTLSRDLYDQVKQRENYVTTNAISSEFLTVLVANEDKRFYDHIGFDAVRIIGAVLGNIRAGELETGGSTITQQLAKNLFYTQEQTLSRKVLELGTAIRLELYFSKRQLLEMYVNVIYYGSDAYGISQASQTYFNKRPAELTLDESAMLVGLLPAPSVYNPNHNLALAKQHQAEALKKYQLYIEEN